MSAIESVTPETRCPSVHGGLIRHMPRINASGTPVTMPHLDQPYGGPQTVILAACCNALLVPPPDNDAQAETVDCGGIAAAAALADRSSRPVTS